MSMVQEIPHETSRIRIDRSITDRFGMPAARLSGRPHPATIEAVHYMSDAAATWVTAAGGSDIRTVEAFGNPQGSEHSAGTARMGNDPALSATNSRGLLWGTTNVFVADASLHPTNGGFNPALTVMANAMRVAELMVREG
jgi:choline dehydrogenase-like flavoprotein